MVTFLQRSMVAPLNWAVLRPIMIGNWFHAPFILAASVLRIILAVILFIFLVNFIEKSISLNFESIEDFQPLKVPQKEINLVLFEQIDVYVDQTRSNLFDRINSKLDLLERVAIQIEHF